MSGKCLQMLRLECSLNGSVFSLVFLLLCVEAAIFFAAACLFAAPRPELQTSKFKGGLKGRSYKPLHRNRGWGGGGGVGV